MAAVAMAVVGLMMITITYDVLARYLFAAPTDWAYPLNSTGVLVATMLAVPHLYATGHHISMDLLHRALPQRARRAADLKSEEHTSELQSRENLVCRLLLEKKNRLNCGGPRGR